MECPVCYAPETKCKLVCGHSFCYQCINHWYQEFGKRTCPMCREDIQFFIEGDTREIHIQCTRKSKIEDYTTFQELLDKHRGLQTKEIEYLRRQSWVAWVVEYRAKDPIYTKYFFNGLQGTQEACYQKRQEEPKATIFSKTYKE